jgi:hypothetical protein
MAKITAAEAEKRMGEYLKGKTGRDRIIPPVNKLIQDTIREKSVFCFNVGPWGARVNMGSLGYYFIPACEVGAPMEWIKLPPVNAKPGVYIPDLWEEGDVRVTHPKKEYAAFRPIPGMILEPMPKDQDTCEWNMQDEGRYFAEQLLGVGIGHDVNSSWIRKGCFIAEGSDPTEQELAKAKIELVKFMEEQIRDADRAWDAGPQRAEAIIRPEIHHVCADWLNLRDRKWLRGTDPKMQKECDGCGEIVNASAMTCKSCGYVLDPKKYEAAKKEGRFAV